MDAVDRKNMRAASRDFAMHCEIEPTRSILKARMMRRHSVLDAFGAARRNRPLSSDDVCVLLDSQVSHDHTETAWVRQCKNLSGSGAKQLFQVLEREKTDVEANLRNMIRPRQRTLTRCGDGGVSVTVCKNKAGTDESLKVAREWITKNASNVKSSPPTASAGSVIVEIK